MILDVKYNINTLCKEIVKQQLDKLNITYSHIGVVEIEIQDNYCLDVLQQLNENLNYYGCEIIENSKNILVEKIKDTITEMIFAEQLPKSKISIYISNKLNYKYSYLSHLFSEVTYSNIENFIMLQKTERAKQLIITTNLNVAEIACKLNYSSQAHFSSQFKNITGLTPSSFKRIIQKRRQISELQYYI